MLDDDEKEIFYGEQTVLTVQNMSFTGKTLSQYPKYLYSFAQVKKACALANYRANDLSERKFYAISAACDLLMTGEYLDQFPVDVFHGGGGIGLNMNMNEVLAGLADNEVRPVDDVNMCQSTSDVCHTSLRLTLIRLIDDFDPIFNYFINVVQEKGSEFNGIMTIARTCLQDGMAVPVSVFFEGFASALLRQEKEIKQVRELLHNINLGGTVIGSGTGSTMAYRQGVLPAINEITGLELKLAENLYDAAQYPDDLATLSALVRRISANMAKFAADLRLLSSGPSTGLSELRLPAVQAGSSFFPGKVNPIIPETIMQCSMLIAGNDSIIQDALDKGEIHLNLWESMMGFLLIDSITMLTKCTQLFNELCISGIGVNVEVCETYAHSPIPEIVRKKEKYGYEYVTKAIKENRTID